MRSSLRRSSSSERVLAGLVDTLVAVGHEVVVSDTIGDDATKLGMLTVLWSEVREVARAVYDAGDNPTRETIREAISALGPIDGHSSLPDRLTPPLASVAAMGRQRPVGFPHL